MSGHLKRKNIKKGLHFSIMVIGQSGLGKSTFVNTLVESSLIPKRESSDSLEKTLVITPYSIDVEEDRVKMSLTIIDTPGFGDNIDNESNFSELLKYIEYQYDEVLLEETRIKRNPKFLDNRVDVVLYFIAPTGHALKELDILLMKQLSARVNIVPLIAKSDSLSRDELVAFKKRIREDMAFHKIQFFNFPYDPDEDDEETIVDNKELQAMLPFAVVGAEDTFVTDGRQVRGRQYPWGIVDVDNSQHCEFSRLRYSLLVSHLQDLKDITHDVLYEKYREVKLSQEETEFHHSRTGSRTELQEGVAKQVQMKEELLRQEEEKLREKELAIQRELESKRRELLLKEQSLRDLETKLQDQ